MKLFNLFKKEEPKEEITPAEPPKKKKAYDMWLELTDEDQAEDFFKHYKKDMNTMSDYSLTVKELKEYYDGEYVYKYFPYSLPFKIEGNEVYSYIKENDWILIGKIREGEMQYLEKSKYQMLFLYPNIYKIVSEDGIDKVEDDPYFNLKLRMPPQ